MGIATTLPIQRVAHRRLRASPGSGCLPEVTAVSVSVCPVELGRQPGHSVAHSLADCVPKGNNNVCALAAVCV